MKKAWHIFQAHVAFHLLQLRAALGDAKAQYMLGCHFDLGVGVRQDVHIALTYYSKVAGKGYA